MGFFLEMVTVWRIIKTAQTGRSFKLDGVTIPEFFNGEGARLFPGRWNSKGVPIVYAASSQSLATLELLVNLGDSTLLENYSICSVTFREQQIQKLTNLPEGWDNKPPSSHSRRIGDSWVSDKSSVVLSVPSAVIPDEVNFLLNPQHPDFSSLEFGRHKPFPFDERLGA
jgi:RES domain-containing protein